MEFNAQTDPLHAFDAWLSEAKAHPAIREATAMAVATVNGSGEVHNRVVLCKDWTWSGFTFFTNYRSQKGRDLESNGRAGAVFYWDPLFRQVKITGRVSRTNRQVSVNYWDSRARESQLSQFISKQSETVDSRAELEAAWHEADRQFQGRKIPCPEHWGGFLLVPEAIEFWQGLPNRLHDRFLFEKNQDHWTFRRLYP
jgi:pyridoxamine 5'-phosphate oxidase